MATRAGHFDDPALGFLDHGQLMESRFDQSHQVHVDHLHIVFLGQPFIGTIGQAYTSIVHQGPEAWGHSGGRENQTKISSVSGKAPGSTTPPAQGC